MRSRNKKVRSEKLDVRNTRSKKYKKNFLFSTSYFPLQRGQALITLLFFTVIGVTVTSAAVVMILINSYSGTKQQQGELAYEIAQSGAENAILRVLRDPTYTGETLTVDGGTATITVTGNGTVNDPYVILSKGANGIFLRQVQVTATYVNNLLSITSRKEVYQ